MCTLPWLGFVPDKVTAAPPIAVDRLAEQLSVDLTELRSYRRWAKTRTERLVAHYLGWRPPTTLELKELDEFLLARALEHDSPTLLFRLACEYLISARVIRPGPVTVVERVAHARAEAQRETFDRLAHEFTETRCAALDRLLVTDPEIRTTRLRWLATGPVEASPAAVKAEVAKLELLRSLGADALDLSVLPAERRRFLATVGAADCSLRDLGDPVVGVWVAPVPRLSCGVGAGSTGRANLIRAAPTEIRFASGGSQDQTVDRDRDQPGRHAGFALQPHGPVWSRDHVAGKGLDGMMLGLVACS